MKKYLLAGFMLAAVLGVVAGLVHSQSGDQKKNIMDNLKKEGNFKTLTKFVKTVGMQDMLQNEGPFTFFAPSDTAFDRIPKENQKEMLRSENKEATRSMLMQLIVPGRLASTDLTNMKTVRTLQNTELIVTVNSNGGLTINDANVLKADIEASNGIIHAIDRLR